MNYLFGSKLKRCLYRIPNIYRIRFNFLGSFLLLIVISMQKLAYADCLGLGIPPPQNTNVCETLVEQLVIPKTKLFCNMSWFERILMPHCNLPGACHVDPSCKSYEVSKQVASHILNTGDLYCDFREIEPKEIIEKIAQDLYTDTVKLTTGENTTILYTIASAHIDILECKAKKLSSALKSVIKEIVSRSSLSQDLYFYPIDIDRVRIISRSVPLGDLYLRNGFAGITLGSVVIINDDMYQILSNWKYTLDDVVLWQLEPEEEKALFLMIHELVHVRQYRNMGNEQFVNRYLTEALKSGYINISTEQEASSFEDSARVQNHRTNIAILRATLNY